MAGIGIGAVLLGYSLSLYGYILIRGYDIGFVELFHSKWPPEIAANQLPPGLNPAGK